MAGYSLSSKAAADLESIYEYTILQFGLEQARAYLLGLHERFQMLAEQPTQGRNADELAPGLQRVEYQSRIVLHLHGQRYSDCACASPTHGRDEASVAPGEWSMQPSSPIQTLSRA
jgi:toxin ParE1/3/4